MFADFTFPYIAITYCIVPDVSISQRHAPQEDGLPKVFTCRSEDKKNSPVSGIVDEKVAPWKL